ncbi:hypothetical protein KAK06_14830 [Ideonella sp. 4Y11]|uniref:Uncharacterized protein n=1 Tax=Ideonella aquatica TaxID=2824119 RepID=A0A940YKA3_9BURK|nr:hypothetical protein [Ideonella aquatica]MBQ0960227.1 hypothetical protein [Ideonella aquatica]
MRPTLRLLAACGALLLAGLAQATSYRISLPGPHNPHGGSIGRALNERGDVAALWLARGDEWRAVLYKAGRRIDLARHAGLADEFSEARGLNDHGVVVGQIRLDGRDLPFVDQHGAMQLLPVPEGLGGAAQAINSHGDVLAVWIDPAFDSSTAVLYHQGVAQVLPHLRQAVSSYPRALNQRGVAVGLSRLASDAVLPVMWHHGRVHRLGRGLFGQAEDLNDAGDVVGGAGPRQALQHAMLWRNGQSIDLDPSPSGSSGAHGINNRGQIVGQRGLNGRYGPFLWENGQMRWLDDLIVPEQQGLWQLYDAYDINDAGQILAWGYRPEEGIQALLLEPVEP